MRPLYTKVSENIKRNIHIQSGICSDHGEGLAHSHGTLYQRTFPVFCSSHMCIVAVALCLSHQPQLHEAEELPNPLP